MNQFSINYQVPEEFINRGYEDANKLPEYRSEFMRDRGRLMYATAFRRLSGKTQIYTVGSDDHRKNRLTHTLEVAQIARTIAFALGLNPDLAEAIALGHDFGHTPFGHAGERMLHEIMIPNSTFIKDSPYYCKNENEIHARFERETPGNSFYDHAFGFKHNLQSVRVAALLEDSYRNGEKKNIGLNLTNFTLYGMMIHSKQKYDEQDIYPNFQNEFNRQMKLRGLDEYAWSFEAAIVKWADDIAQWHHDLEDAMREGVLPLTKIRDTIKSSLANVITEADHSKLESITDQSLLDRRCIAELSHIVVNTLVNDLVDTSKDNFSNLSRRLQEMQLPDSKIVFTDYQSLGFSLRRDEIIGLSKKIRTEEFKDTIKASIHHSRNVERMNEKGKYIIRKLFEAYYSHPQQLPDGPILHLLVDIDSGKYKNIDDAKKAGIGEARVEFDRVLKNPKISIQCMLMFLVISCGPAGTIWVKQVLAPGAIPAVCPSTVPIPGCWPVPVSLTFAVCRTAPAVMRPPFGVWKKHPGSQ